MDPTTDPMRAAVEAVLASEQPIEDDTPDPEPQEEDAELEEDPTADAEVDASEAAPEEEPEEPNPDDQEDEPAASDEAAEFLIAYKANGEDRQVSLEEAKQKLALVDGAHARMQKAAEREKLAEQAIAAANHHAQQALAMAQALHQEGLMPRPVAPDPRLGQSNPQAYFQQLAVYQDQARKWETQQSQLRQTWEQSQQFEAAQHRAALAEQAQLLAERIPAFAKAETAKPLQERLVKGGVEFYRFTADEVVAVTDSRLVEALHDAVQWRELQANKTAARKSAPTPTPRHVPPASAKRPAPMSEERKAYLALRKTGSIQDAVRVVMARDTP